MTNPDAYKVVTTRTGPGYSGDNAHQVNEVILSREGLSAQYPRSRTTGGLIVASYGVEVGIYDEEQYEERIESAVDGVKLAEDPRSFDDELDPSMLPKGYRIGEGYAQWQARTNSMGGWYEGVENSPRFSPDVAPTVREKVSRKIADWLGK